MSIDFPEIRTNDDIDWEWTVGKVLPILNDAPEFIAELAEKFNIGDIHIRYHPCDHGIVDDFDDYAPMLENVSKLKHLVTSLSISLSAELVESSAPHPMPLLKTLHMREDDMYQEFVEGMTDLGTWMDLRTSPIEVLRLTYISMPHPIRLPETITTLSITEFSSHSWGMDIGFFRLPNLVHLELINDMKSTDESPVPYDESRDIISTNLRTLQIEDCKFRSQFFERVAISCSRLHYLRFRFVTGGSQFIKHFADDRSFSCLEPSGLDDSLESGDDDYFLAFLRGCPAEVVHVVYYTPREKCDCASSMIRCLCDMRDWELREISHRSKRTSFVILRRQGSTIMLHTVKGEVGKGHNVTYRGRNLTVHTVDTATGTDENSQAVFDDSFVTSNCHKYFRYWELNKGYNVHWRLSHLDMGDCQIVSDDEYLSEESLD